MATEAELAAARRNLITALGPAAVEAERSNRELKKFNDSIRSMASAQNMITSQLVSSNNVLLKGIGSVAQTMNKYSADIKSAQVKEQNLRKRIAAAQIAEEKARTALARAMTGSPELQRKAALAYQNAQTKTEELTDAQGQTATQIKKLKVMKFGETMIQAGKAMIELSNTLRETQKQFGFMAGQASALRLENLRASISSAINTFKTLGKERAVSSEDITQMQLASQGEFGGVLTSAAAEKFAKEASSMGISSQEFIKARRVFMTQSMGDSVKAEANQKKFIAEFTKKGLTSKEAVQVIAQNADLIARNGTRFQQAFARAAIDAKKIGVDLGKVSQIGDNIINDFEGFLESQATLGAMGFGFDSSRLAEIAATGDDAALFDELRSQLANTGKDITKLNRSERLELESAFGINIGDMLKLAGKTPGQETKTAEQLQEEANGILARIENLLGPAGGLAMAIGKVAMGIFGLRLLMGGGAGAAGAGAAGAGAAGGLSGLMRLLSNPIAAVRRAGGAVRTIGGRAGGPLAGLLGGIEGYSIAKKSGKGGYEAGGAAAVQGGSAAGGAVLGGMVGTALAPFTFGISAVVGPILGGVLGNTFGKAVNKYFPSLGANLGLLFKGMVSSLGPLRKMFVGMWDNIKKLGEPLSKLMNLFGGTTDKAGNLWPVLEKIGNLFGFILLRPINLFVGALSALVGTVTFIAQIITGDFSGAFTTLKGIFRDATAWIVEPIKSAIDVVKSLWNSMVNWFSDKVPNWVKNPGEAISNTAGSAVDATVNAGKATWEGIKSIGGSVANFVTGGDAQPTTPTVSVPTSTPVRRHSGGMVGMASDELLTILQRGEAVLSKVQLNHLDNIIGGFNKVGDFGTKLDTTITKLVSSNGPLSSLSNMGKTISSSISNFVGDFSKNLFGDKGKMSSFLGGTGDIKEKAMGFASKIPGVGSLLGGDGIKEKAMGFASKIPGVGSFLGGTDGIKEKAMGFASKVPGLGSLMGGGGIKEKAMGFASKVPGLGSLMGGGGGLGGIASKIPGLSSISGAMSGFKEGGVGGALKSLAGGGAGKLIGGALGTLIPIPGVGTMLGSLVGGGLGKGIGKVGGFVKNLFGKKKPAETASGDSNDGLMGGAKGFLSSKVSGVLGKLPGASSMLGKIPGIGGIAGALTGSGGMGGAIKSLASGGIGKMIGGALGTAIPIPGVGTMIGSLAGGALGKGIGKVGGFVKNLFGKKKSTAESPSMAGGGLTSMLAGKVLGKGKMLGSIAAPASPIGLAASAFGKIGGLFKKKKPVAAAPEIPGVGGDIMQTTMTQRLAAAQQPQITVPASTVDTTGIEQKLNNFINALQGVQINMDGTVLGKILVNNNEKAAAIGVFRQGAPATL